jgi:hypothetical protein
MNISAQVVFGQQPAGGDAGFGAGFYIVYFALIALMIAGMWAVFTKAGKPGWASIVPIYNGIVILEIVGKPIWWILLYFIPCVNFIIAILVTLELAKVFGKGGGFAVGMIFLPFVFYPILGFGEARYQAASAY